MRFKDLFKFMLKSSAIETEIFWKQNDNWIDLEYNRPPYYTNVLVYFRGHSDSGQAVAWLASDGEKDIWTVGFTEVISEVSHWQPLPPKPRDATSGTTSRYKMRINYLKPE